MRILLLFILGLMFAGPLDGRRELQSDNQFGTRGQRGVGLKASKRVAVRPLVRKTRSSDPEEVHAMLLRLHREPTVEAMLRTIAWSEGTAVAGIASYAFCYSFSFFSGFKTHPQQTIRSQSRGKELHSTAAGRYQILYKTWLEIADAAALYDFGPLNQDLGAIFLIYQYGALDDVLSLRIEKAVLKLNRAWSSFPGSPYGQPTKTMRELVGYFRRQYAAVVGRKVSYEL